MAQLNSNFNNFFDPPSNRWVNSSKFERNFRRKIETEKKIKSIREHLRMLQDVIFDLSQELNELHQLQTEEVKYE